MKTTFELDKEFVANTYARFPIDIVSGKGAIVKDSTGKEYIDLGTGIAVNTFGVADEVWIDAVTEQLKKVQHTSNLYYSSPCANLAQLLCEKTGMKKVFFGNSGAEANECAIKVARQYGVQNKGGDYFEILTLKNSFHGRTITTLAATGQDVFHQKFLPLTQGFVHTTANDVEELKRVVDNHKLCAIMFETVQGEGGVLPLDKEFVEQIAEIARQKDILIIVDEVQTGNGRTGELYGYMNYGITPDIVTTAKGLGGGLPLGACMLGEKVKSVLGLSDHGSTFGGNPVACAGAISIINRIDDNLLAQVKKKSKMIFDTLQGCKGIKSISGMGLMIGIETELDASEVISECMKNGVLVIKAKNKVRLLPPLNIDDDLLNRALGVIKKATEKLDGEVQ